MGRIILWQLKSLEVLFSFQTYWSHGSMILTMQGTMLQVITRHHSIGLIGVLLMKLTINPLTLK